MDLQLLWYQLNDKNFIDSLDILNKATFEYLAWLYKDEMRIITSRNYVGIYCSWCLKNNYAPLAGEVLHEIFLGCESNEDFAETLNALFLIQTECFKLSFMKDKNTNEALKARLFIRIELFKRVPSATNMLLAYNLIEELLLQTFAGGKDITKDVSKSIDRLDKCRDLAINTKFIHERKLAFERSFEIFKKLTQIEI